MTQLVCFDSGAAVRAPANSPGSCNHRHTEERRRVSELAEEVAERSLAHNFRALLHRRRRTTF